MKARCAACADKDGYIRELELALKGAVWPQNDVIAQLRSTLSLTGQQAHLVATLYAAKGRYITPQEIAHALPVTYSNADERSLRLPSVVISYVRTKLGRDFIETHTPGGGNLGYRLSPGARKTIDRIIKHGAQS